MQLRRAVAGILGGVLILTGPGLEAWAAVARVAPSPSFASPSLGAAPLLPSAPPAAGALLPAPPAVPATLAPYDAAAAPSAPMDAAAPSADAPSSDSPAEQAASASARVFDGLSRGGEIAAVAAMKALPEHFEPTAARRRGQQTPGADVFPEPLSYRFRRSIFDSVNHKATSFLATMPVAVAIIAISGALFESLEAAHPVLAMLSLTFSTPMLIVASALLSARFEMSFRRSNVPAELNCAAYAYYNRLTPERRAAVDAALRSQDYRSNDGKVRTYHPFLSLVHPDPEVRRRAWQEEEEIFLNDTAAADLMAAVLRHYEAGALQETATLPGAPAVLGRDALLARARGVLASLDDSIPAKLRRQALEATVAEILAAKKPEASARAQRKLEALLASEPSSDPGGDIPNKTISNP